MSAYLVTNIKCYLNLSFPQIVEISVSSPLFLSWGEKVYKERHTQISELHAKYSTVTACNVLFFQMQFALLFF